MDTLVYGKKIIGYEKLLPEQLTEGKSERITFGDLYKPDAKGMSDGDMREMEYAKKKPLSEGVPEAITLVPAKSSIIWITENSEPSPSLLSFLARHQVEVEQLHQDSWHTMVPDIDNVIIDLKKSPERSMAMLQDPQIGEFLPQEAIDMAQQILASVEVKDFAGHQKRVQK